MLVLEPETLSWDGIAFYFVCSLKVFDLLLLLLLLLLPLLCISVCMYVLMYVFIYLIYFIYFMIYFYFFNLQFRQGHQSHT